MTITSVLLRKSLSADNRTYYRTPFFWRNEDFSRIFLNFDDYSWIVMNTNFSMIVGVQRYLSKLQVWLGWVINRCGMDDLGIIIVNLKINVKNFQNFHFRIFQKNYNKLSKMDIITADNRENVIFISKIIKNFEKIIKNVISLSPMPGFFHYLVKKNYIIANFQPMVNFLTSDSILWISPDSCTA